MVGQTHQAGCRAQQAIPARSAACCAVLCILISGCYAPIHSGGIAANTLSNEFRWPQRTSAMHLNYSCLVGPTPSVYLLGPGDRLEVTVPDLIASGSVQALQVTVLDQGEIHLPRLGPVIVGGLSLAQAQEQINAALANRLLQNPGAMITLVEKGTVNVLVLGAVKQPGVHALPRFENDVAHALAAAQGFTEFAGEVIEIHRRPPCMSAEEEIRLPESPIQRLSAQSMEGPPALMNSTLQGAPPTSGSAAEWMPPGHIMPRYGGHSLRQFVRPPSTSSAAEPCQNSMEGYPQGSPIIRIPLRGMNSVGNPADVVLNAADVVIVPRKSDKVFYVVGPLSPQSRVRFSVGDRDREIGSGLLLPEDREVDVVTAVAMAGYIDPIESPTTVTVHRTGQNGMPMLIRVDLIAARTDPSETILVQSGDIIYLNPDPWWYYRRMSDRIIDRALGTAAGRWLTE